MSLSVETIEALRQQAISYGCGSRIAALDDLHRSDLYTTLVFDRLARKYKTIQELFAASSENWNQTFYALLFRTLGGHTNRNPFMSLAQRATYTMILRERSSVLSVEALLFGTSGLLEHYPHDSYINDLHNQFDYLSRKYQITPIQPSAWRLQGIKPNNHPLLRIAQAAAFLSKNDFVIENLLACRNAEDVYRLFGVEASTYWSTHYIPGDPSGDHPKRIGRFTSNIIGINTVALLQYTFGSVFDKEQLRSNALSLLEVLPAEENYCIRRWQGYGLKPRNAFETQALLQLGVEYCAHQRCAECPVALKII
ncbi:MAG: DUF2851 family protein [Alistipes sp.]